MILSAASIKAASSGRTALSDLLGTLRGGAVALPVRAARMRFLVRGGIWTPRANSKTAVPLQPAPR